MKATCLLRTALFGAAVCWCAKSAEAISWTPTPGAAIKDGHLLVNADVFGATTNEFVGATARVPMRGLRDFYVAVPFSRKSAEGGGELRLDAAVKEVSGGFHVHRGRRKQSGTATVSDTLVTRVWCLTLGPLEDEMTVEVGIANPAGCFDFDLSSFRIVDFRNLQPPDDDREVSYPASVRGMPPLRGVMLPPEPLSEDGWRTLSDWGATLVRFQMVRNWGKPFDNRDTAEFARWLDGKLDTLVRAVLPAARQHGMKVCVDLHVLPGGGTRYGETNMFFDQKYADAFVESWRKIAARLRGSGDVVYGYDLCNEPNQIRPSAQSYWALQRRAAAAIREIDPDTTVIVESNQWAAPDAYAYMAALPLDNVIYQVHMYEPLLYTHQGIKENARGLVYPDAAKGVDKEWLRRTLRPVRDFQMRHGARIYVGEFSAVAWAPGAAEYIRDCISIFEEYGWDWTYHAFREWPGWSVEHEGDDIGHMVPSADNPRKRALLDGFKAPKELETAAIQSRIDDAWRSGGGTVEVEAGVHRIGVIRLRSNVTLLLRPGAVLQASRNLADYDGWANDALEPVARPRSGDPNDYMRNWYRALIRLHCATNAAIVGEPGSVIDGCNTFDPEGEEGYRGAHGITAMYATNCVFRGYTMRRTGNWSHHFRMGRNLRFEDLAIDAGHDGIHLRQCDSVEISKCRFRTGDDAVAGFGNSNVHVHDCDISSACSAFRFGGRHVLVENCVVHGPCDFPFRGSLSDAAKTEGGEGELGEGRRNMLSLFTYFSMSGYGLKENAGDIVLRNIRVSGADRFLQYNYSGNEVWSTGVPMDGITFENVTATGLKFPLCAYGDAAVPLALSLKNCRLSFANEQSELVRGANLSIDLSNVEIEGVDGGVLRNYGPKVDIKATDVKGVKPSDCKADEQFSVEAI